MSSFNRFKFERKAKAHGAVDKHKAPLPPGRCRDLPVLSLQEQIQRLRTAHALTKVEAKQAAADHQEALWDVNMQLQQAEEEVLKEAKAHQGTKLQLFQVQDEVDEAKDALRDKDKVIIGLHDVINALRHQLAATEAQRDRALADSADLHTALQAAEHTITQQSTTISTMQQQLAAQVSAMSRLHSELSDQFSSTQPIRPPAVPQQQQQQQQQQGPQHSHAGVFSTLSGYLPAATAVNTLRQNLVAAVHPLSSPPALDPGTHPTAPSITTTDSAPVTPDRDVLSGLKATASSWAVKSKQGVLKGWSRALAFGADSGLSTGLSLSTTHSCNPSCSSGGNSVEMSRWGSSELSMSAAGSRLASSSSNSSSSNDVALSRMHG